MGVGVDLERAAAGRAGARLEIGPEPAAEPAAQAAGIDEQLRDLGTGASEAQLVEARDPAILLDQPGRPLRRSARA